MSLTSHQISAALKQIALNENLGLRSDLDKSEMKRLIMKGAETTDAEIDAFLALNGSAPFWVTIEDFNSLVVSHEKSIEFLNSDLKKII